MSAMNSLRFRVILPLLFSMIFIITGCATSSSAGKSGSRPLPEGEKSVSTESQKKSSDLSAKNKSSSKETVAGDEEQKDETPQENGLGIPMGETGTENVLPGIVPLPQKDPVEEVLANMSLSQKIGQRFITWLRSKEELPHLKSIVQTEQPAGVIIYPKNFRTYRDMLSATTSLGEAAAGNSSGIKLFICTDQEGGRVQAFHYPETFQFPAPWFWGRYEDPDFISSVAYILGRELRTLGFNMDLAPVLDLYEKPDTTVIGDRSMGNDPEKVAGYAAAYISGLKKADILPVAKHFPGHGVSVTDSHQRLPVSDLTQEDLLSRDLIPFKAAIDDGLPVVLTGHILFPRIDEKYPVTLSEKIIREILRGKLGFDGVVMSDAIEMGALSESYTLKETLVRSIKAGVDIILIGSLYELPDLIKIVETAIRKGELSESEIDDGVRRILRLKLRTGLLDTVYAADSPDSEKPGKFRIGWIRVIC